MSAGVTKTNFSGGIVGGISNGNDIYFTVSFKPVSTIMKDQKTINKDGNKIKISERVDMTRVLFQEQYQLLKV